MKITGAQVFEARGTFVSRDLYVDGGMLTDRDCGGEVLDAGGCYAKQLKKTTGFGAEKGFQTSLFALR